MAAAELKTLGRYNIERVLGKGAMGVVYEGVDPRLNRRVAIKTILKSNLDEETAKEFAMRFVREAQAVARLNHPNIVQVYDFGEEGEVAYLVMEFIRGKELKNFFDANERFDLKEAVRIMGELCDALEFAHQHGIVHRDIKPANVMIDSQARTKLTDFGVARIQDSDKTSVERTQAGTMVGTPAYMSPEQITGAPTDKRSDVFSAGIILYQFLTGEKPFTGGGAWTIAKKIIQENPPLPSSINNAVTPLFDAVVNKALAKNPDERYQSAKDLALALRRALEGRAADDDDSDKTVVGGLLDISQPLPTSPRPAAAAASPESTKSQTGTAGSQEVELEFWRAIKDGNDPDDFELYVQQFPTGIYAALAKRKIAKLRGIPLDDTSVKAKEQEKKEAEEAARREAEAKQKLADEKAKLEAELKRKEEEFRKREAEAEAKREQAEKARLEAIEKAKQEAEKARLEAIEKAKQEAAAERERARQEAEKARQEAAAAAEKAKQEAAAELARREAEYRKREQEAQEKAKQEAAARAKQDAEARAKREAEEKARKEAEEKARKDAEARAKKEAEDRAKREAEFKKREAELKAREADATLLASGKKKGSPVVPIIIGLVVAAIAGGAFYALQPTDTEREKQLQAMQKQLQEAKQKAAELELAKKKEEEARVALEKARAAEEAARKAGDARKEKELAEARVRAEAEAKKQAELRGAREADARKSAEMAKAAQDKASQEKAAADRAAAEKARIAQERAAAERAAADRAAAERAAEQKAAAERALAEARAIQEKAARERAEAERVAAEAKALAEKAAAERAAAEKAKTTVAVAPSSGEALFEQAAAFEQQGNGKEAVRAYTRAARSGSGKAAKRLGEIYDKGLIGVSRDYAESLKWYNAARVLGEEVPMARSR